MKSGAAGVNGVPSSRVRVGLERHRGRVREPNRPEHRRHDRERVDADVDHRPDRVEGARIRCRALDPIPVRLGVDDAHLSDRALANELPHRLLRLAEQRCRRTAQPTPCSRASSVKPERVFVSEREWLLAVDVLARHDRCGGDVGMRLRDGQVDDRVDRWSASTEARSAIGPPSVSFDERLGARAVEIGHARELESVASTIAAA